MGRTTRTPVTEHQENVLNAVRRLRKRGIEPASPIEIGREAGFRDQRMPYANSVDGYRTVSASSHVQSALVALINHGLLERVNVRRGGGAGAAYRLLLSPEEEFVEWVLSIERDDELRKTVTLRQIVERARATLPAEQ